MVAAVVEAGVVVVAAVAVVVAVVTVVVVADKDVVSVGYNLIYFVVDAAAVADQMLACVFGYAPTSY